MTKKVVQKGVVLALFLMAMIGFASAGFDTLKINEFSSSPLNSSDWVELFYPTGNGGIDTGYCLLRDGENNELQLSGVIFSGGIGYYNWSNKLNNEGDVISLVCQGEVVDQVTYGGNGAAVPPTGISAGRCPESGYDTNNDASDFALMNPSKGGVNDCSGYSSLCGNGELNEGEQCDAGEGNGLQCNPAYGASCTYCSIFCTLQPAQGGFCGDGTVNGREQCDDGNSQAGDGCSNSCREESSGQIGTDSGLGGDIGVEEFAPMVWQCGERILTDDEQQPWRISDPSVCYNEEGEADQECLESWRAILKERANNYLFEGEKFQIDVVVFDKNKIQDVTVDLILGESAGDADYNVNCVKKEVYYNEENLRQNGIYFEECNAHIDEEEITAFDSETMEGYTCTFTTLDLDHMYGRYWVAVQAEGYSGEVGIYDEVSPLFLNPIIELDIDGALEFEDVRPGTLSYSTVSVENMAEGGVQLDMFIAGKNWPAADTDMGRCLEPSTGSFVNYLPLEAFRYYADKGAYNTRQDEENDDGYSSVSRNVDYEGYVNINQLLNDGFEEAMFDDAEILQAGGPVWSHGRWETGYRANVLTQGEQMALTFRLDLPEPCYGQFESAESGSIFIFGEAI